MAEDTETMSRPKGTAFFERKVQVREYEAATAGIHVGFDFDPDAQVESPDSFASRAATAFYEAKAVVYQELGIDFDVVDGRIVEKLVEKHFGNATEVKASGASNGNGAAPADTNACPDCGGGMWDNRGKKASGQFKANSPDFVCKDKQGCGKGVWLQKRGS